MFCSESLVGGMKAKEHVFRKSWLERLGHLKTPIDSESHSGRELIERVAGISANAVQAGDVCRICNNGWMQELDNSVDDVVMGLASSPIAKVEFTPQILANLARCLLMHASCCAYTDSPARRHVPRMILDGVREPGFVPEGFFMFCSRTTEPTRAVNVSTLDAWPARSAADVLSLPQARRMKFGIQLDNVIFGFAWADVRNPGFSYDLQRQSPLLTKGCRILATNVHAFDMPPNVMNNAVTRTLISIGVRN